MIPIRKLAALSLLTLIFNATAKIAVAEPTAAKVLVLCDQSPGSMSLARAELCRAHENNWDTTLVTDVSDFSEQINSQPWERIAVYAQHAETEPAYIGTLRTWSFAHPNKPVHMGIWKVAASTPVLAGSDILASTAFATWQFNESVIGYALIKETESAETISHPALLWPNFNEIELRTTPTVVGEQAVALNYCQGAAAQATLLAVGFSDCELQANLEYIGNIIKCESVRKAKLELCEELYGPTETDPGDPPKYTKCRTDANKRESECLQSALELYNLRIEKCKKDQPGNGGNNGSGG